MLKKFVEMFKDEISTELVRNVFTCFRLLRAISCFANEIVKYQCCQLKDF
jgi:hypothetical protein